MANPSLPKAPALRRGFTIVELLITILLIAVLTAVALPSYSRYRDRIKTAHAAGEIGAMAMQIVRYADDARAFPPSLAAAGIANRNDPWGRPYEYYNVETNGRGGARKDHALNPLNTDFDLYSLGPDGKTKKQISQKDSLDDIIRASNGKFVGVAADF
jgi:general secretion pathway protein G